MGERERGKRLFIAVNLSIPSTRRIAEVVERLRRAGGGPRVTWVPAPNLHVTVKFLGWTRPDAIAAVRTALEPVAEARRPFEVEAVGAGAFPRLDAGRVLWIGVQDPSGQLATLAGAVEARMVALGYPGESHAYHPHVTIGRVRDPGDFTGLVGSAGAQSFGPSTIQDLIVYESTMKASGSEYTVVARVPLGEPPRRTERQTRTVESETSPAEPDSPNQEPHDHGGHGP